MFSGGEVPNISTQRPLQRAHVSQQTISSKRAQSALEPEDGYRKIPVPHAEQIARNRAGALNSLGRTGNGLFLSVCVHALKTSKHWIVLEAAARAISRLWNSPKPPALSKNKWIEIKAEAFIALKEVAYPDANPRRYAYNHYVDYAAKKAYRSLSITADELPVWLKHPSSFIHKPGLELCFSRYDTCLRQKDRKYRHLHRRIHNSLILAAKKDPSEAVQKDAIYALSFYKNHRSFMVLSNIARNGNVSLPLRKAAIAMLSKYKSRRSFVVLRDIILSDNSASIREAAISSLFGMRHKDYKPLVALLRDIAINDESKDCKWIAIKNLFWIFQYVEREKKSAIDAFTQIARHGKLDAVIRNVLLRGSLSLYWRRKGYIYSLFMYLKDKGFKVTTILNKSAADATHERLRWRAIDVLGYIGDTTSWSVLKKIANENKNAWIGEYARRAAERLELRLVFELLCHEIPKLLKKNIA